jgi:hypothetical protein
MRILITSWIPAKDPAAAAMLEQYGAAPHSVLVVCPNGTVLLDPTEAALGAGIGMLDTAEHEEIVRRRRRGRRPGRTCHGRVCGLGGPACGRARLPLVRRTGRRERPYRELSRLSHGHFGQASRAAPSSRRRSSARR